MDAMDSRIEALLRLHEGERLKPYTDTTGHLTIGVGRNLTDVGITAAESEMLLRTDVARTRAAVCRAWPWVEQLDPVRQAVVLDMAFNLGGEGVDAVQADVGVAEERALGGGGGRDAG